MIWKPVPGFDGWLASEDGQVQSPRGCVRKQFIDGSGYLTFMVARKNRKVHRFVALAFHPNPENLPCVNHKDGNKLNNHYSNLEWCTFGYNISHAFKIGINVHYQTGKSGRLHRASKPLISINQTAIIEHESRSLCAKYLKVGVSAVNRALSTGGNCRGHQLYSL